MTFLILEDVNLLRGIFLVGKMSRFLAAGWVFPHSQGFKGGDIFRKKADTWCIIRGDNLPKHCSVLRDLVPTRFFK